MIHRLTLASRCSTTGGGSIRLEDIYFPTNRKFSTFCSSFPSMSYFKVKLSNSLCARRSFPADRFVALVSPRSNVPILLSWLIYWHMCVRVCSKWMINKLSVCVYSRCLDERCVWSLTVSYPPAGSLVLFIFPVFTLYHWLSLSFQILPLLRSTHSPHLFSPPSSSPAARSLISLSVVFCFLTCLFGP